MKKETCDAPAAASDSTSASASAPTSSPTRTARQTSSSAATRAKKTATPATDARQQARRSAVSSSALLMSFALALFCEKTPPSSEGTPRGPGTDSALNWSDLVMRSCPSDSERVALALTTGGKGCACSPSFRTPNARDWKGMSAKSWRERTVGDKTPTLPDQIGGVPHPDFAEALMGFPIGHTDSRRLETP